MNLCGSARLSSGRPREALFRSAGPVGAVEQLKGRGDRAVRIVIFQSVQDRLMFLQEESVLIQPGIIAFIVNHGRLEAVVQFGDEGIPGRGDYPLVEAHIRPQAFCRGRAFIALAEELPELADLALRDP